MLGAAASGSCTEGTERAAARGARGGSGARPAPLLVFVSWVGLPMRSPRGVSLILGLGATRSALGVELLELGELAPALVDRRVVVVRLIVQVAPALEAKAFAVGLAEWREGRREDELLAK